MPNPTLKPLHEDRFDYAAALHLLNRAGFGGSPAQVRALADLGLRRAVAYLVRYEDVAVEAVRGDLFDSDIMRPATEEERRAFVQARRENEEAAREALQRERQQRQRADRRQIAELQRWWLERMIETPRPLEEKMTLFWHGHFATGYRAIEDSYHMFVQNELFRANALGDFRVLVAGIIRDPAMLKYLNNDRNVARQPNENLARELMELFTLGEGNGYTEDDIKEGARALTGYTFQDDAFVYRGQIHDAGPKRIFGAVGTWDGDDFVRLIFERRAKQVSEFICLKLYRYFVNDLPGDEVPAERRRFIQALARKFRDSGFSIRETVETLLLSEHFHDPANVAAQIKSPVQLAVQAIRSLRTPVRSLAGLAAATDLMGQNLFFPPSVKGWEGGRSWMNTSTLFIRQNLLVYLLTGRRPDAYAWETDGRRFDATHLVANLDAAGADAGSRELALYLLRFALGTDPLPDRVETIERFLAANGGGASNDVLVGALALIAAMPEYQLC